MSFTSWADCLFNSTRILPHSHSKSVYDIMIMTLVSSHITNLHCPSKNTANQHTVHLIDPTAARLFSPTQHFHSLMVLADSWPQPDWPPGSVQVWVKNVTLAFLKLFHCVAWTLSFKDTTACSSIDQSRHSWAEEATLSRGGWVIRFYHSCYWLFIWASLTGTMKLLLLDRTSREIYHMVLAPVIERAEQMLNKRTC